MTTPATKQTEGPGKGLAIASMVVGIVAFLTGWTPFWGLAVGITAVVLGIIGLKKGGEKGLAITGIVTGGLAALTSLIFTSIAIIGMVGSMAFIDAVSEEVSTQYEYGGESTTDQTGIKGGMYKVGADMAAGEYVVIGSGYLQISSDSSGSFESIIENDNYTNRTIFLVKDGQYVEFSGRAYAPSEAPKVDTSDGELPAGKYKVGVDLPAGEYKLVPIGSGYYGLSTSASDSSDSLVSNDNFDTERYLTVQDGQYLKISRATLKL
ncbi:DUF4190 domain-containing protein [Candidatus Saccharibacteria bacterium]|nr:DUF4190 domain-containing protein [Candidatus Saccharibacteria bacterium]NCS82976.1 DUF4190 domain-containing protein [Candidatus Saccharibacteria bacterium]